MITPEENFRHLKTYLENIYAMGSCKSHMLPFLNIKGNNEIPPFEEKEIMFVIVIQMELSLTNIVKKWWGYQWI